jgi:RNA polymerase sigma-70 factor, ECF subfamily
VLSAIGKTTLILAASPDDEAQGPGLTERVRAAQRGDVVAFEALYREHVARIFGLAVRLLGNVSEAESLVQDVFVKAWEKLADFRGESAFPTWLHAICVSLVLMQRRSVSRRLERVTTEDDLERADPVVRATLDPGTRVDLERAIERLPNGARLVFVLHDVEGYAHTEIAARMGITENTCKAQLHRARGILKEWLDGRL